MNTMEQRPPTRLCEILEQKVKGTEAFETHLRSLRNPPYFENCQPSIDAYVSKIRELQEIVRQYVGELNLEQTETDGAKYGHLFGTSIDAVLTEFGNWGLPVYHCSSFANTGHLWVTVRSARFKSEYDSKEVLERMKAKRDELNEKCKPINLFVDLMDNYSESLRGMIDFMLTWGYDAWKEESDRLEEVKKSFISKTVFTRKGILSLCFVNSLLYRLEQSLDLSQNHPGD